MKYKICITHTVKTLKACYTRAEHTLGYSILSILSREEFREHLRQDQGILRIIVVIQSGLLGVRLIMEDRQLAQDLHKSIGFWYKHCELQ